MRILVVEDDDTLREYLQKKLAETGFGVDVAANGEDGLFAGLHHPLDAAIVDIGLPKLSGLQVIQKWRASKRTFPVVILTARDGWQDKVEGLDAGADDYVGKPFSMQEILARLRALLRRANGWTTSEIVCGPFALNTVAQTLSVRGAAVDLTTYEYRLLQEHAMFASELRDVRSLETFAAAATAQAAHAVDVFRVVLVRPLFCARRCASDRREE